MTKNAVELVKNQKSGVFNRLFLVPKPNKQWRPILDLSSLNKFLKAEKIKMETRGNNKDLPPGSGVGDSHKIQGRLLPYTHLKPVQEVPAFSHPGSNLSVQSTTIWSVHSPCGIYSSGEGGQTDCITKGYIVIQNQSRKYMR